MIFNTSDRQGFGKSLSGVAGTSIESVYRKPDMEASRAVANNSWLPYPYGELPDKGPWTNKEGKDNEELPVAPEGSPWTAPETPGGNVLMFAAIVGAILLIFSKKFF